MIIKVKTSKIKEISEVHIMKNKFFALPFILATGVILAGCGNINAQSSQSQASTQQNQTDITAAQAQDIAVSLVDDGTFESIELAYEDGLKVYDVTVSSNAGTYRVLLNTENGALISLDSQSSETPSNNSTSEITRDTAIELAEAHLASIGATNARFQYAYLDSEDGRQVWSVEFDGNGRSYEFYVDVQNGEFLKAPNSNSASSSSQAATAPTNNTENNQGSQSDISRERAVEIAQGVASGDLIEVDNDFERGRSVWYVAIRSGNLVHEVYVDRTTGEIVLHESYSDS